MPPIVIRLGPASLITPPPQWNGTPSPPPWPSGSTTPYVVSTFVVAFNPLGDVITVDPSGVQIGPASSHAWLSLVTSGGSVALVPNGSETDPSFDFGGIILRVTRSGVFSLSGAFGVSVTGTAPQLGATRYDQNGTLIQFYPGLYGPQNASEAASALAQSRAQASQPVLTETITINPGVYAYGDGNTRIRLDNFLGTVKGADPANKPIIQFPNGVAGWPCQSEWTPYGGNVGNPSPVSPGVLLPTKASNYTQLGTFPYDLVIRDLEFRGGRANQAPESGTSIKVALAGAARLLVYHCKFQGTDGCIATTNPSTNVAAHANAYEHYVQNEFYDCGTANPDGADNHYIYTGAGGALDGGGLYYPQGESVVFGNKFWSRIETRDGTINGPAIDDPMNEPHGSLASYCCCGYFVKGESRMTAVIANAFLGRYSHMNAIAMAGTRADFIFRGNICEEAKWSHNEYRIFNWETSSHNAANQTTREIHIEQNTIVNYGQSTEALLIYPTTAHPYQAVAPSPTLISVVDNVVVASPNEPGGDLDSPSTPAHIVYPTNTYTPASGIVDQDNMLSGGAALDTPVAGSQNWAAFEYVEPMSYRARTDSYRGGVSVGAAPTGVPAWLANATVGRWELIGAASSQSLTIDSISASTPVSNDQTVFWPRFTGTNPYPSPSDPIVGGVRSLISPEGDYDSLWIFSGPTLHYGSINYKGVVIPGPHLLFTGGGHSAGNSAGVYALGPFTGELGAYTSANLRWRRIVDPPWPFLDHNGLGTRWNYNTQAYEAVSQAVSQVTGASINGNPGGGPGGHHSYGHLHAVLERNAFVRMSGAMNSGGIGNHAGLTELDLTANHRNTNYNANGEPTSNYPDTKWIFPARSGTMIQDIGGDSHSECGTAESNGYFWLTYQSMFANDTIGRIARTLGGAMAQATLTYPNGKPVGLNYHGIMSTGLLKLTDLTDDFKALFVWANSNLQMPWSAVIDTTNVNAPTAHPIVWDATSVGPVAGIDDDHARRGGWAYDWRPTYRCLWGYSTSKTDAPDTGIFKISIPGITPGYLPGANYRTAQWHCAPVAPVAGGDPMYRANSGGSAVYKGIVFMEIGGVGFIYAHQREESYIGNAGIPRIWRLPA